MNKSCYRSPAGRLGCTTISDLNDAVTNVNEAFAGGEESSGYLVDPCCEFDPARSIGSFDGNGVVAPIASEADVELGNYPNPFNPTTAINFVIKDGGLVTLKVYNLMGQEVATLVNNTLNTGSHQVMFNGTDLPSGLYLYRLDTNGQSFQQKMLLIK